MPEQESFPFPMFSGLLEPEHYQKIGNALWLFVWCVSATTKEFEEDGTTWGAVLGGKPIAITEIAEQFGNEEKTIRRWMKTLESGGYIRTKRVPYGQIITVRNSKKFKKRSDIIVHSEPRDRTEMSELDDRDRTLLAQRSDKSVHSNKILQDIKDSASAAEETDDEILNKVIEVENHFCQKRGSGFNVSPADFAEIKQMIADGIPVSLINRVVTESFDNYRPKHKQDKIRSITYCVPRCYDEWTKLQPGEPIIGAVPHVPIAIGSPPSQRKVSRQQKTMSLLDQMREEEQKREQERSD